MLRSGVGAFFALFLLVRGAHAQTVHGTVYDAASEEVVPNAVVSLLDDEGTVQRSAVTDAEGTFELLAPRPGAYRLSVELIGYAPAETSPFSLGPGDSQEFELHIEQSAIPLDPLVVTVYNENRAGFERRRDLSYGTRIGPEEFARLGSKRLNEFVADRTHFLSTRPLEGLQFFDMGRCKPMLFVDGERALYDRVSGIVVDLDRWIDRDAIRAVELYRPGRPLPSPLFALARRENQGQPPTCGVIAVWTDEGFGME